MNMRRRIQAQAARAAGVVAVGLLVVAGGSTVAAADAPSVVPPIGSLLPLITLPGLSELVPGLGQTAPLAPPGPMQAPLPLPPVQLVPDQCAATDEGYPAECAVDPSPDDVTDPEPGVTLQPMADNSPAVQPGSPQQTAPRQRRFRISVAGGVWATLRNNIRQYVIGEGHDGWVFDAVGQASGAYLGTA